MEIVKNFLLNLGFSLLGYLAVIIFSFLVIGLMSHYNVPFGEVSPTPIWVRIILWVHVIMTISFLFFIGKKLKLLGSQWLNYLSVFGITVIVFVLSYVFPYFGGFVSWPFSRLTLLLGRIVSYNIYIGITIFAFLPSIIIWLGMLFQTKKCRCLLLFL